MAGTGRERRRRWLSGLRPGWPRGSRSLRQEEGGIAEAGEAADALSVGAAGAGGVRARWAACRPRPERGEGLGCGRAQRRGEVAGVGAARVVGEEERGE